MSYSKLYFGKEITELTYQDILDFFIEEKEESDKIEFKSYVEDEGNERDKENVILKNVCAMLNSEGGLIIWGAPVGKNKIGNSKYKIYQGELSLVETKIEKDNFIRRVTDGITPSPIGIIFISIEYQSKYVYVIQVEKSNYSPHQFQNKYWMRVDGLTVTAPHHYIEALFKKITFPKLEGYIKIENAYITGHNTIKDAENIVIVVTYLVYNTSKLQNEYDLHCRLTIGEGYFPVSEHWSTRNGKSYSNDKRELSLAPAKDILFYGEPFLQSEHIAIFIKKDKYPEKLGVNFYFGGRSSPMMISQYVIDLTGIPSGGNFNSMFSLINENQYLYEISEEMTSDEKSRLKEILGR